MAPDESQLAQLQSVWEDLNSKVDTLALERQHYLDVFSDEPHLVTDAWGKVVEANAATSALLEIRPQFLLAKPFSSFIVPARRRAYRGQFAAFVLSDEEHAAFDTGLRTWLGAERELRVRARRMPASMPAAPAARFLLALDPNP